MRQRFFPIVLALLLGLLALCGCREAGNNVSAGFGSLGQPGATAHRGLGLLLYNVYRTKLSRDGDSTAMATLADQRTEFIDAVNAVLPPDISTNLYGTIHELLPLIDDGTFPAMAQDVKAILTALRAEDDVLEALIAISEQGGDDHRDDTVKLLSRLLAYPDFDGLVDAIGTLLEDNDGVDDYGQPNGERDILRDLMQLASSVLRDLPDVQGAQSSKLSDVLLTVTPQRDGVALGEAAWCVRLGADGLPVVRRDVNGSFLPPFVDLDGDGKVDTANGEPVDATGAPIELPAFGSAGVRDAEGRALTAQGELVYEYYDSKKTVLGSLVRVVGDVLRDDVHEDFLALADGVADRAPGGGFSDDNPLIDVLYAGLEMFKGEPSARTLWGLAALLDSDPDLAEQIFVDLGTMVEIVRTTPVTATSSSGSSQLDLLVPLLDEALESNGSSTSAARELFSAFSSEQQRLGNLPQGFAIMMRYHDYGAQVLAGAGQLSSMESLLDMVREADQCNNPLGGGTLAELYLDTVGGNGSILGIPISISTMNLITTYLGQFLCGGLTSTHIDALQDFDNTGTLDAFTPIAEVFSDRGQTRLLVDIMVALSEGYENAMRPMEPALVDILESGAVDAFFDAFDKMNQVAVPGTGEVVSDAIADALSVLVDDDTTVFDRHGNVHASLAHLLFDAIDDLDDRLSTRGLDDEAARLLDFGLDIATATTTVAGQERLTHSWLIPLSAAAMEELADGLPTSNTARIAEVEELQQDGADFLRSADYALLLDVLLTVEGSSVGEDITDAVVNLFTPRTTVADDVYGALLPLVCSFLSSSSGVDPNDLVTVGRFAGEVIDPAAGMVDALIDGTQTLLAQDDGRTVLTILRNAFYKGPNGVDPAPLEILLDIFADVSAHSSLPSQGPTTVASLKANLTELIVFIDDDVSGLQRVFNDLSQRTF